MGKVIAIVGMCGSGKSVLTKFFEDSGYKVIYFGGVTMKKLEEEGLEINPENEKYMRERLRKELGMAAYAIVLLDDIKKAREEGNVVLDGVYSWSELKVLKDEFEDLVVISVVVDKDKRYERLSKRDIRPLTIDQAKNRDIAEIENLEKGGPIAYADYFILNNDSQIEYEKNIKNIFNKIEKVK